MMGLPRWYGVLFRCYPPAAKAELQHELTEMAVAEWAAADGRWRRAVVSVRLLLDHLATMARAWAAAMRSERRASFVDGLGQDVRHGWRALRRTPGFLAVAVVIIGIGVGATTTIMTVGNALLFRSPAGVRNEAELTSIHAVGQDGSSFHSFSYPAFAALREARWNGVEVAAYHIFSASMLVGTEPALVLGSGVTGTYFPMLGTRPVLGRLLGPGDDQGPESPRVAVLAYRVWRDRFGADSSLVGSSLSINGESFTVVGIAEPGFAGHVAAFDGGLWVPLGAGRGAADRASFTEPRSIWLELLARIPKADRIRARQTFSAITTRMGRDAGLDWDRTVDIRQFSGVPAPMLMPVMGFLGLLLLLGALVMLISSSNIAGVMVARALARARETAIRLALGAGRARLVRQLVIESLIVFAFGGLVGTSIAWAISTALARTELPLPLPIRFDFELDVRVLGASLLVILLTGLCFGLMPALQATRLSLTGTLRDDGSVAGSGRIRLRSVLVTAQVAGSAFLLVTASLFASALSKARDVHLGFDPSDVHVLATDFSMLRYPDEKVVSFADRFESELAARAGTRSVGAIDLTPLSLGNQGSVLVVDGRERVEGVGIFWTDHARVTPGYFATVSLPIVRGRGFGIGDRGGAPRVVILNETLAARIWPGQDPVGRVIRWGQLENGAEATVVGVARTGKYRSLGESPGTMVYLPVAQDAPGSLSFLVKHRPGDREIGSAMRDGFRRLDPDLAIMANVAFEDLIGINLLPNRLAAYLTTAFGGVGLVLATVGLYGVLSFLVVRRRREIGIRMALGAPADRVRRMVLGEGMRVTGVGLAVGVTGALLLSIAIRSLLFGLSAVDVPSVFGAIVVLTIVAVLASDIPARRAAATPPAEVLRND